MNSAKAQNLLLEPHMACIAVDPRSQALSDDQIIALEPFIRWLDTEGPEEVNMGHCIGFARLHVYGSAKLTLVAEALEVFDPSASISRMARAAAEAVAHAENFRGITKGPNRDYRRAVSLPVSELPEAWRDALEEMKMGMERHIPAPAPSIYTRLENRLCMFAFSARNAGREIDLNDLAARQAFYADLVARSSAKNDGTPRYAYIRSAFEELHRFARYCGMPKELIKTLHVTMSELARKEVLQRPKKWVALDQAPSRNDIRDAALEELRRADGIAAPHHRHAARNRALAMALSCYDPARPLDFSLHTFGETVFWEEEAGEYRLHYYTKKSSSSPAPVKIDAMLPAWLNPFFEAVILQDAPVDMLAALRAKALRDRKPLITQYDGNRAVYQWYSRTMKPQIGTGAHGMRVILATAATELMPAGEVAARLLIGHRQTKHLKRYVAARRTKTAVGTAHFQLDQRQ